MKTLSIFIFCFFLISCNQVIENIPAKSKQSTLINIDSLTNLFLTGWNSHDSAAIMRIIAENAIVMNDSVIHQGNQSISQNWISGGVQVISNIKTYS